MPDMNGDKELKGKTYEHRAVNTKREDIFSNASKEIRLTTKNPLEDENDSGDAEKNTRELFEILEYLDKVQKSGSAKPYSAPEKEADADEKTNDSEADTPILHKFDSDEDKTEVFEKKSEKSDKTEYTEHKHAEHPKGIYEADSTNADDSKSFEPEQIPVVNVSAGKFSNVVRQQYDEYIKFDSRVKNNRKPTDEKISKSNKTVSTDKKERKRINLSLPRFLVGKNFNNEAFENEFDDENDVHKIKNKLYKKSTSLYLSIIALVLLTVGSAVFFMLVQSNKNLLSFSGNFAPVLYCIINMIIVILTLIAGRKTFISGIKGITQFGNFDTALSVAGIAVFMQSVVSFFYSGKFYSGDYAFYSLVLLIIYLFNTLGKLIKNERIRKNYSFLTSPGSKYSVNNFTDKRYKPLMLSGVASEKTNIAYQKKVQNTNGFFDLSYNNYSGLTLMNKASLPLAVLSAVISVIYGVSGGACAGFTSFAIICCCCVPVSAVFGAEFITKKICKNSLQAHPPRLYK